MPLMEVRLRDANGGDVGTVDVDDDLAADSALSVDGKVYVRNQRNEGQWREVPVVKAKGSVKTAAPAHVEGSLPPVSAPRKDDDD